MRALAINTTMLLLLGIATAAMSAPTLYQYQSRLTGDVLSSATGETLGGRSAIARSGEWLMLGATSATIDGLLGAGKLYVFRGDAGGQWHLHQRILSPEPQELGHFGRLAVEGDTMLVGASTHLEGAEDFFHGAVYVYRLDPASEQWKLIQELRASNPSGGAGFGSSILLMGKTAFISAHLGEPLSGDSRGGVYVFERDAATGEWSERQALFPDRSDNISDLALDGDILAVGSHAVHLDGIPAVGMVFIFERDASGDFHQVASIEPDPAQARAFGQSLALHDGDLLIGAHRSFNDGASSGTAWLYRMESASEWRQALRLAPSLVDPDNENAGFGFPVVITDTMLFIGSSNYRFARDPRNGTSDISASGIMYTYRRTDDGAGAELVQILAPPDPGLTIASGFGGAIHLDRPHLFVGAPVATVNRQALAGAVYELEESPLDPVELVTRAEAVPPVVTAGEETTFLITVTNKSPVTTAHDVVLYNPIQTRPGFTAADAMEFISASDHCVLEEIDLVEVAVCGIGTLPPGASAETSLTVRVNFGVGPFGTMTHFATALAREPEPNTVNNTVARAVEVIAPEPEPGPEPEPPPRRSGRGALSLWMLLALSGLAAWRHKALRRAAAPLSRAPGGA